jgi:hypothetical protein
MNETNLNINLEKYDYCIEDIEEFIDLERQITLDDEVVLKFLILAEAIKQKTIAEQANIIKWVEKEYEDLRESDLADFLNDFIWCLLYCEDWDELHTIIRDLVYDSDLNLDLLLKVSENIVDNCI